MPNVTGYEYRVGCLHEAHLKWLLKPNKTFFIQIFIVCIQALWNEQSQNQEWNIERATCWSAPTINRLLFYFSRPFFSWLKRASVLYLVLTTLPSYLRQVWQVATKNLPGAGNKMNRDWTKIWQPLVNHIFRENKISLKRNHSAFGKRTHLLSGGE